MLVMGKFKKIFVGGLMLGSLALTGCLTDDDDDDNDPPVNNGTTLTNESVNDTVWNILGPNRGSFDLINGVTVAQSAANGNKDAVDMSVMGASGVTFPKTWTSLNSTMFVTAPSGFDYAAATDSTVIRAYKAGSESATTKVLAANDIILAKLRAGNRYAAIKINAVVETSDDNRDYILFSYKLTP